MNLFSNKSLLRWGRYIIWLAIVIWVLSTGFYLIQDGWHLKPIDPMEKQWDHLVGFLMNIGFVLYAIAVFSYVVDQIENKEQSDKSQNGNSSPQKRL